MITYLLPILIGATGGRMVYGIRGGVVGAIATMGVIAGTDIPMFLGAMIMGPLGGWLMKKVDAIWDGKVRPGFEMLIDNFSAGIVGLLLAAFGFFGIGPIVSGFSHGEYSLWWTAAEPKLAAAENVRAASRAWRRRLSRPASPLRRRCRCRPPSRARATPASGCSSWEREPGADDESGPPAGPNVSALLVPLLLPWLLN